MAEISQDERKAGLAVAVRIDDLALDAPDVFTESVLHAASHRLRRRFGYSLERKKIELLRRVKREPLGVRVSDLKRELGFHIDDVLSIVKQLEGEAKVTLKKIPPAGSKGGRPTLLVRYLDAAA